MFSMVMCSSKYEGAVVRIQDLRVYITYHYSFLSPLPAILTFCCIRCLYVSILIEVCQSTTHCVCLNVLKIYDEN
jgi:hypothetical protein